MMYQSSELIFSVGGCVKAKVSHERRKPLYKEAVTVQLRGVEACLTEFPSSYYRNVATGDKYGAVILKELQISNIIIGTHIKDDIIAEQGRRRRKVDQPHLASFNTSSHVVKSKM